MSRSRTRVIDYHRINTESRPCRLGNHRLSLYAPRCGATIAETIEEVPSFDVLADRESDAQGYAEQTVACPGCDQQFDVGIRNTGACLVANLMKENIHVSVSDDPVNTPEDAWEVEAYQRENLPSYRHRSSNLRPTTSVISPPRWRGGASLAR